jgi:hypothetical protein
MIASQAAVSDQPAKGTLDFPPMMLDLKAAFGQKLQDWLTINEHPLLVRLITGLGENFSLPAQQLFDPRDERTGVAVIGKQMAQAREASHQLLQEQACSLAIAEMSCMDQNGQGQALRINQEVSSAPKDFFPPSKPRS